MHYTKSEINAISNATLTADCYLDTAYTLLYATIEKYFEHATDRSELQFDSVHRPEIIESALRAVWELIRLSKVELDVFINPNAAVFQGYMADIAEKQEIMSLSKAS